MKIRVLADAQAVAREVAVVVAAGARASVAEHGRFLMAVSGGRTLWMMRRST
jgi:6-phosphogluconolactonase/glucosamine-6-phosphate isomerase/deaminase